MILAFFSPKALGVLAHPQEIPGQTSYVRPDSPVDALHNAERHQNPRFIFEISQSLVDQAEDLKLPYLIIRGYREKLACEKIRHKQIGALGRVWVFDLEKKIKTTDLMELDRIYGIQCCYQLWGDRRASL